MGLSLLETFTFFFREAVTIFVCEVFSRLHS